MKSESSETTQPGSRMALARQAAVLQIKLIVDGARDAALIPISLVAAIIGIFRGGEDADREFHEVLKLGRRTERWINLFGYHRPYSKSHPAGSMDTLINTVEDVLREQYEKGRATKEARDAIEDALEGLQDSVDERDDSVEK